MNKNEKIELNDRIFSVINSDGIALITQPVRGFVEGSLLYKECPEKFKFDESEFDIEIDSDVLHFKYVGDELTRSWWDQYHQMTSEW